MTDPNTIAARLRELGVVYMLPKGGKYHWSSGWTADRLVKLSACSVRALLPSTAVAARRVPTEQRCRRAGCAGRWHLVETEAVHDGA